MYLLLFFLVLSCSVLEITGKIDKRKDKVLYYLCFFVLTAVLCFRFGQGTDYCGYLSNYVRIDEHSERLFAYIQLLFRRCGLSFGVSIAFWSIWSCVKI